MANIYVTNKSEKPLKDGFSGIVYEFLPGKTVEIPEEAAQHIFGYKDDDKQPYLARLGWAKTSNDIEEGLKILAQWEDLFRISHPDKGLPMLQQKGVQTNARTRTYLHFRTM